MEKQKLVQYNVRIRPDQAEFLRRMDDAAQFLRDLIDRAIAQQVPENKTGLLSQQVKNLEHRIEAIKTSPIYLEAKRKLTHRDIQYFWDRWNAHWLHLQAGREGFVDSMIEKSTISGKWAVTLLHPFNCKFSENSNVLDFKQHLINVEGEDKEAVAAEAIRLLEEHYPKLKIEHEYLKKVVRDYEDEIAKLEEQITKLKQEIAINV